MENSINLLDDSLQKLRELRDTFLAAQSEFNKELAFAKVLAERSNKSIPDEFLLDAETDSGDFQQKPPKSDGGGKISLNGLKNVTPGEFFNKSLTEATRIFVEREGGLAPWLRIVEALKKGGYPQIRNDEEIARARLNILKGTTLVLIPENNFGLVSIYGGKKRAGRPKKK